MENVLLTVLLINALLLIGAVLLQRSEGGGLMSGGGGGVMSGRAAATALAKLTWIFGATFFACAIALTIVAAKNSAGASVLDRLGEPVPAAVETPEVPAGEDLLPPAPSDAPVAPPRAD
ncbi:preprotein translocase subunit SecG [Frigidibacter sp. ROC022]|uniref:preprotein translocase subunit SecG n=1 Tax=Frigidibacter sp. ROC022 TaxID=2971796 RepID=UPI00215ACFD9|nr:preprotein translocase subunit SecG [Frigidibacter sp. ROC022]MCR8725276.1 preprotein translocase subunit SecG [Frigidibacter sp. ROC022]